MQNDPNIYYEHPAQFFQQSDWPQSKEKAQNRRKVEYKEQEESMLPAKLPNYATILQGLF